MENTINNQPTEDQPCPDEPKPRRFDPHDLIGEDGRLLKLVYSIQETAFLLDCDDKTIRRYVGRGLLQTSKAIRHIKITADSIRAFMQTTV